MGVDIGSLFDRQKISFKDLQNRVIAIDAHNVLHQFLSIIRGRDGNPLKDSKGRITSHLSGILYRTGSLVESHIKPVYIFDGEPHLLKAKTLEERRKRKIVAEEEYQKALEEGDLEKARTKAQQTSKVTDEIVEQSKKLLDSLGIPYIQAPGEGEAQASYIVKQGDAHAVGSQDYDCLLIGTPVLVKNLTSSGRRKLPGKKSYVKITPELVKLKPNLKKLGISREQLVDMAILIGTDFNEGIKGIGPKTALKLIKKNGNAENVIANLGDSNAPTFEEIKQIRKIFLEPEINEDYSLKWSLPDKEKTKEILCDRHQFSENRVEKALKKYDNLDDIIKQQTLF
ncbi:MAG: flap endonuclease-1 [Candidatus Thermoplasmatota archaeon]